MSKNDKQFKVLVILNIMIIALLLVICIILLKGDINPTDNSNKESTTKVAANTNYDVSDMNEVNLKGVISLFDSKKQYVLYIGRANCSSCAKFLPILKEAQKKYNYTTQYLDITKVDGSSNEMAKVVKLLDNKTTINMTGDDGEPEEITETYGNLLKEYGLTPVIVIINKGKMVAGSIGSISATEFEEFLNTNGIK